MKLGVRMVMLAALAGLGGCGGSGGGAAPGKNAQAAEACDTYAKSQLADKTYKLDRAVLATSMKAEADGSMSMTGPIVIAPGTNSESKQTLECNVRFVDGKDLPDVIKMQFIW